MSVCPFGYILAVVMEEPPKLKPLYWVGSSKRDLLALPEDVVDVFGYALYLAQTGRKHEFQKKAKRGIATPKADLDLIRQRMKAAEEAAKELES